MEQKIIKTGNLRFETNDLDATYTQIQNAVKQQKQRFKTIRMKSRFLDF
jgi:predicted nucleic-acid-binding Zn-ribbon protein